MNTSEVKISPEFKAQTTKAIFAIIYFILTYIIILILSMILTAMCVYGGIMLIISFPKFITIVLGAGLASMGVLILIFLLKFVFKSHKVDRSHLYEIKKDDEPELFELITEIVQEVQTSFPKKVYLTSEVNAAVFYDSNFWSMFLPIKKNLQIGLGLVNTVTKPELKAILSHEFGHFSQRTMKVGSYVYNVNQVIYNMLYDNDSYEKLIQSWSEVSGYISFFVAIAVKIIEGIQLILQKLYLVINKSYMALSREMEFHADEIAANVTGSEPLKSSLLRMSLADHSFSSVLSFYEGKIKDGFKSKNLYREHSLVMSFMAKENELPIKNGLPEVSLERLNKFNKSKLVIEDQWASHPSTEERINRLDKLGIEVNIAEHISATNYFLNIGKLEEALTEKLFESIPYKDEVNLLTIENFQEEYQKQYQDEQFNEIYNGYYNDRNITTFSFEQLSDSNSFTTINNLFSNELVDSVYENIALQNDIESLKQIVSKTITVKTFDYDGKKYDRKEAKNLLNKLNGVLEKSKNEIDRHDIKVYLYFKNLETSQNNPPLLDNYYTELFKWDKEFEERYNIYIQLTNALQFINYTTPFEEIHANFSQIELLENELKENISFLMNDSFIQSEITHEIKENFDLYLSKQWKYFGNESYFERSLETLFSALNNYAYLLSRGYFMQKKRLLDYQAELELIHL